ncbi:hypothetical protein BCR33DRAFT_32559 [Rhizoclosmatium globosum]|uniref:Uncharacterized protein n=1 Tax=Rhizoclosmatium globosum TaxID=329046 RepID=A0A1Y2AWD1_9FUNG|nr:hypothetical protein BCR33DRAFT_32559 [Rhizoclosmatium globosum]|eukprot:ORY26852.1 hypothetical protein BCR33DRAFT_32559 [Rhizoclosmatium globosum]
MVPGEANEDAACRRFTDTVLWKHKVDPEIFNAWYRRDGWEPPVHVLMILHWGCWLVLGAGFWGFLLPLFPRHFSP